MWILIEIRNLRYVGVSWRSRFGIVGFEGVSWRSRFGIVGFEGVNWRFIVGSFLFVKVVGVD
jgi:hypothetical protein